MNAALSYSTSNKPVAVWLLACCFMVFCMVLVGGLTRLTDSGLSMVNWQPVHGILPPIGEQQWQEELNHYRQSPQYQKVNAGMSIEEFKSIFWLEYYHRLAGRLTGLVFFIPFLIFIFQKRIRGTRILYYATIFSLGGLQGLIGWWMVKSGLVDRPMVAPYRLSLHLLLAFTLFALLLWSAMREWGLKPIQFNAKQNRHRLHVWLAFAAVIIQICLGAWVAGLDAGLAYNTWPLMDGDVIPAGLWLMDPLWHNFIENGITTQFLHRWWAFVALTACAWLYWQLRPLWSTPIVQTACETLLATLIIQIALGIATLLGVVPLHLASLHQMIALILVAQIVIIAYVVSSPCPIQNQN